jgi:hypothetical protein
MTIVLPNVIDTELEFLKRLWGLGTEEEEGYRTGPPGYIGWWNSFLGIDSGAPYTFKNTSSGDCGEAWKVAIRSAILAISISFNTIIRTEIKLIKNCNNIN